MKAAITDGTGNVWIDEAPMPEANDYQCLCRIEACATCSGTDRKIIDGKLLYVADYPGILGHESFGTVIEVGAKVRNIKVGDRFLRPTAAYPGERIEDYYSAWGGFAEYGLVTDAKAFSEDRPDTQLNGYVKFQQRLPAWSQLNAADATMLITLKEAASYVPAVGIGMRNSVLILGAGPVALSMLRFAKIFGAWPVVVAGRRDDPLARAKNIGADFTINVRNEDLAAGVMEVTEGKGVGFILDTAGNVEFLESAATALAENGKVAPYAIYEVAGNEKARAYEAGKDEKWPVAEARMVSAAPGEDQFHQYLVDAVRLSLLKLSDFYSHKMPFAEIKTGFEMIRNKQAMKIVLEM